MFLVFAHRDYYGKYDHTKGLGEFKKSFANLVDAQKYAKELVDVQYKNIDDDVNKGICDVSEIFSVYTEDIVNIYIKQR